MNNKLLFIIISLVLIVVIMMLSVVEMKQCELKAMTAIDTREINSKGVIVLSPKTLPIKHTAYIYLTDTKNVDYADDYIRKQYITEDVGEHFANLVLKPFKSFVNKAKQANKSYSPINTMYNALSDATNVVAVMSLSVSNDAKYILEHHVEDDIHGFIADEFVYLL